MKTKTQDVDDMLIMVAHAVNDISPRLYGLGPMVQSAVLADLFAMFLAGHVGPDAPAVREKVIVKWLATVRKLIPGYEQKVLAVAKVGGHG